jgi:hypothetical protein
MEETKDIKNEQIAICRKYDVVFCESPDFLKVGISRNIKEGARPINGLRHPVEGNTTGWYIWGGEEFSEDPDFFVPLHVEHLQEWCPLIVKYLGLPPGWRFLVTENYEDVWEDKNLLTTGDNFITALEYKNQIKSHYETVWGIEGIPRYWYRGPIERLHLDFCVLEFAPSLERKMWTYATCWMSTPNDERPLELHLFSPVKDDSLIELLTVVASFHKNGARLDLDHTVNFGRPWLKDSQCSYGLITLPYLDGPRLEDGIIEGVSNPVKFYWLIPITKQEVEYKKKYGADSLEEIFESTGVNYIDLERRSVCD